MPTELRLNRINNTEECTLLDDFHYKIIWTFSSLTPEYGKDLTLQHLSCVDVKKNIKQSSVLIDETFHQSTVLKSQNSYCINRRNYNIFCNQQ